MLFPKLANDEWLIKKGILAYMMKNKKGETEPPSQEEIAEIRNRYSKDTIFYTEPIGDDLSKSVETCSIEA